MVGYGSRHTSYKQKADQVLSLYVNRLQREGCLSPGSRGHWSGLGMVLKPGE